MSKSFKSAYTVESCKELLKDTTQILALKSVSYTMDSMATLCNTLAVAAGWYHSLEDNTIPVEMNVGERYSLMHSELSESFEGARVDAPSDKLPGFYAEEEELADALIRIFDYAGARAFRLGEAMYAKLLYNKNRKDHKPEVRAAGGKQM